MKVRYVGSESTNHDVAPHRDGNSVLRRNHVVDVPEALGKSLIESSSSWREVAPKNEPDNDNDDAESDE